MTQTLVHGDACPQNLLIRADGSAEFVAIDWSRPGAYPIGFDLAQLLAGWHLPASPNPATCPRSTPGSPGSSPISACACAFSVSRRPAAPYLGRRSL
ncbi:phosphotransferase [Sphaerisporangium flaviroseum]|uniref:phosphotransferase n=1 Tax=Sphaerisporangium flaviroseum TaxID=509199 RepID=UPI003CD0929F